MIELTNIDIKILEYINNNGPTHINKIKSKFSNISEIEYRIKLLSEQKSSQSGSYYIPNSSYINQKYECSKETSFVNIEETGIYEITELGKKSIRDFKNNNRTHKREIWLKNAWIPIIVSLASYMLLNYIVPMLLNLLK